MTTTTSLILVVAGGFLCIWGILYVAKPDIFQQGFWKRIDISRRLFSPEKHSQFVKVLGGVLVGIGFVMFMIGMADY
ncbi:MAG: hypothetical protein KJ638_02865 [Chloroflexi bacterium]|nr:hypothetical protein [Chloroflexota bacterium]